MKNRFYGLVVLILLAISLGGCPGPDNPVTPGARLIVGTWQFTKNTLPSGEVTTASESGTDMTFTFSDDDRFTFHDIDEAEDLQDAGIFSLDEAIGKLTLNSNSGDTWFLDNFLFLDDNTFTTEEDPEIKNTLTWKRMAQIDVVNHSFEIHDPFMVKTVAGDFNASVVGWETTQPVGTFSPSTPSNPFGFDVFSEDVPDGVSTVFTNGNGGLSQVLQTALEENMIYKLEVEVGDRIFMNLPDSHSAELRAGGVLLASGSANPANGTFTTISFEYTTKSGDPFGFPLEVHLLTNHSSSLDDTVQINWDNVRFFSRTSP